MQQPIYLLTYDHGGYIAWRKQFEERLKDAIDWLQKYPSFKLGLDNEAFAYDQYAKVQPELMAWLKEKLEEFAGRFAIGSTTYGQPLSVFINEESNVRQLTYAIRTNLKYFSQTPAVFAISEHGLHSQIPQLISQAGYQAAIMRTHFMMYGYNPTYSVGFGLWRGEDGSEIPTVPTYDKEGAEFGKATMDDWILTRWPDKTDLALEDFAAAFPHIQPLLASRYDDIILCCEELTAYVEENRDRYQWILLEEIPKRFGEPTAVFAPGANEFVVRMPWGYCGNRIFNQCRQGELQVVTAERLNAWAVMAGGQSMERDLEYSWKNLLVSQHHDIQICGALDEAQMYTSRSLKASHQVAEASLGYLSKQFTTGDGKYLMVYNPLSFPVEQTVAVEADWPRGKGGSGLSVWFSGTEIPCEYSVLDYKDDYISRAEVRFSAALPPMGIRCYQLLPQDGRHSHLVQPVSERRDVIEAQGLILELDEGGIRSMKQGETVYFCKDHGTLFAGTIDGEDCRSHGVWTVVREGGHVVGEYNGSIGAIGIRFTLAPENGLLRCRASFSHHGEKIGEAEHKGNVDGFVHENKLRFLLPLALGEDAVGIRDLPFLVRETDDTYIQGNYWTACSNGSLGIACFNKGAMCMTREKDGLSIPLEYANDYIWGTRMLYGEYEHEFSIYPFTGPWQENDLHRRALAYEYPLAAYPVSSEQNGKWQDEVTFLDTDCGDNVLLSALYPEEGAVIARFYEYKGDESEFSLGSPFAKLESKVDLLGRPVAGCPGKVRIKPYEICSFALRKEENPHE